MPRKSRVAKKNRTKRGGSGDGDGDGEIKRKESNPTSVVNGDDSVGQQAPQSNEGTNVDANNSSYWSFLNPANWTAPWSSTPTKSGGKKSRKNRGKKSKKSQKRKYYN